MSLMALTQHNSVGRRGVERRLASQLNSSLITVAQKLRCDIYKLQVSVAITHPRTPLPPSGNVNELHPTHACVQTHSELCFPALSSSGLRSPLLSERGVIFKSGLH